MQGVAEELDLRRRRPGDQQDADLLADDLHRGGRDVVVLGQLRPGVLDPGAELVLADDLGDDPERRPLEDPVLAQRDRWLPTGSQSLPLTRCSRKTVPSASLQPAGLDDDAQRHRVAGEDDRAGLDLGEADVPRPLLGPGRDREDRDALADRGFGGAERVFARRWTGRRSPARPRPPAGPGAAPGRPAARRPAARRRGSA